MHPSKAFWEADLIVGLLFLILLFSLWSLRGKLSSGNNEPSAAATTTPSTTTPARNPSTTSETPAPSEPAPEPATHAPQTPQTAQTPQRPAGSDNGSSIVTRTVHPNDNIDFTVHSKRDDHHTIDFYHYPKDRDGGGGAGGGPQGGGTGQGGGYGNSGGGSGTSGIGQQGGGHTSGGQQWGGQQPGGKQQGRQQRGGRQLGGPQEGTDQRTGHGTQHSTPYNYNIQQDPLSSLLFDFPMSGMPAPSVDTPAGETIRERTVPLVNSPVQLSPYYVDVERGKSHNKTLNVVVGEKQSTSPVDERFGRALSMSDPRKAEARVMGEPGARREVVVRLDDGTQIGIMGPDGKPLTVADGEQTGMRIKLNQEGEETRVEVTLVEVVAPEEKAKVVLDELPGKAKKKVKRARLVDPNAGELLEEDVEERRAAKTKVRSGGALEEVIEPEPAGEKLDTEPGIARVRTKGGPLVVEVEPGKTRTHTEKREKFAVPVTLEDASDVEEFTVRDRDGKMHKMLRKKKRIPVDEEASEVEEIIVDKDGKRQKVRKKREKVKLRDPVEEEETELEEVIGNDGKRQTVRKKVKKRVPVTVKDELGQPAGRKARQKAGVGGNDVDDREDVAPRSRVRADPTRSDPPQLFGQPLPQQNPIPLQAQQASVQPQLASAPQFQQAPVPAQAPAFHNIPNATPAGAPVVNIQNPTAPAAPMPAYQAPLHFSNIPQGYEQDQDPTRDRRRRDAPPLPEDAMAESKVKAKKKVSAVVPVAEPEPIAPVEETKVAPPGDAEEEEPVIPPMKDLPTPDRPEIIEEGPPISFSPEKDEDKALRDWNPEMYRMAEMARTGGDGSASNEELLPEYDPTKEQLPDPSETTGPTASSGGGSDILPGGEQLAGIEDTAPKSAVLQPTTQTTLEPKHIESSAEVWDQEQPLGKFEPRGVSANPGSATGEWSKLKEDAGPPDSRAEPTDVDASAKAWAIERPVERAKGKPALKFGNESSAPAWESELPEGQEKPTLQLSNESSAEAWEEERPAETTKDNAEVMLGDAPGSATKVWDQERDDNLPSPDTLFEKHRVADAEKLGKPAPTPTQTGPSGDDALNGASSATGAWEQEREDNLPSPDTLFAKTQEEQERIAPKPTVASTQNLPSEAAATKQAPLRDPAKLNVHQKSDPFDDEGYGTDPERESGEKPQAMGEKLQAPEITNMTEMGPQGIAVHRAELDQQGSTAVNLGLDEDSKMSTPSRNDSGVDVSGKGPTRADATKQAPLLSPLRRVSGQDADTQDAAPDAFHQPPFKKAQSSLKDNGAPADPLADSNTVWGEDGTESKEALISPVKKAKTETNAPANETTTSGSEASADVWDNEPSQGQKSRKPSLAEAPAPLPEDASDAPADTALPTDSLQESRADPAGPDDSEVKASPATRATPEETAVKNHGPKDGEQNDGNESEARLIEEDVQKERAERYDADDAEGDKIVQDDKGGMKKQKGQENTKDSKIKLVVKNKNDKKKDVREMDNSAPMKMKTGKDLNDSMPMAQNDRWRDTRPLVFGENSNRGGKRIIDSDLAKQMIRNDPITERDTLSSRSLQKSVGIRQIIRGTWHVIAHAPIWSFFTLATVVIVIEGDRQFAQLVIDSSSGPAPAQKRSEAPDVALTDELDKDLSNSLTPVESFLLLNLWNLLGILVISLMLSGTISHSRKTHNKKWLFQFRGKTHSVSQFVSRLSRILLMGARASKLGKFLWPFSFRRYIRLFLFLLQLVITIVVLQQSLLFAYKAVKTSNTLLDSTPDASTLDELAQNLSPGYIFAGLNVVLAIVILSLTFGWFALLNPAPTSAHAIEPEPRKRKSLSHTTVRALLSVAAVVIITLFIALMYFFSEISTYAGSKSKATETTSNLNILLANAIFFVFTPALGWSLVMLSQVGARLYRSFRESCLG